MYDKEIESSTEVHAAKQKSLKEAAAKRLQEVAKRKRQKRLDKQ